MTAPNAPGSPHAALEAAARRRALTWTAGLAAAVAAWVALTGGKVRSFAFFGVGLVLLWTIDAYTRWVRVRRAPAALPDDPAAREAAVAAQAAAEREQVLAARRHATAVAARPPRLAYGLMALVAVVSAAQIGVLDASVEAAGLVKPAARAGDWWRLLTGTYLHGGIIHFWFNFGALRALAPLVEVYAPRLRLPLVYLVSALAGSLLSLVVLPRSTSVGASGAILGLAGYLLVLSYRRPGRLPPMLRRGLLSSLGLTAALGIFGFAFIDNAGHVGGTAAGALVALLTVPREGAEYPAAYERLLDLLGVVAALVLVAGAAVALARVVPLHFGPAGFLPRGGLVTP